MFRIATMFFSFIFLFGCSSGLDNKKEIIAKSKNNGFNIIKYSDDTPAYINKNEHDDFYEKHLSGSKKGFNVVNIKTKLKTKGVGVIANKIIVKKSKRKMYVFRSDGVVKEYLVSLGKMPVGKKIKMGDGKTPEGNYDIAYHNPNSKFFYSLKISYPNKEDIRSAYEKGVNPGGDIFIHGLPNKDPRYINYVKRDWTNGCIAVSNEDIKEIASVVSKGTPITIDP